MTAPTGPMSGLAMSTRVEVGDTPASLHAKVYPGEDWSDEFERLGRGWEGIARATAADLLVLRRLAERTGLHHSASFSAVLSHLETLAYECVSRRAEERF